MKFYKFLFFFLARRQVTAVEHSPHRSRIQKVALLVSREGWENKMEIWRCKKKNWTSILLIFHKSFFILFSCFSSASCLAPFILSTHCVFLNAFSFSGSLFLFFLASSQAGEMRHVCDSGLKGSALFQITLTLSAHTLFFLTIIKKNSSPHIVYLFSAALCFFPRYKEAHIVAWRTAAFFSTSHHRFHIFLFSLTHSHIHFTHE